MVESLPTLVDKHIKEQVTKQVPDQVRDQVPLLGLLGAAGSSILPTTFFSVDGLFVRSYMSGHILHVHPAQSQTSSVLEKQYQLYLSMKDDPQLQQQDIAIWLALQMKFKILQGRIVQSGRRHLSIYVWRIIVWTDDDEIPTKQMSQDIMEEVSLTIDEAKLKKMADEIKEILVSPYSRKTTPLVQSCQRDPEVPVLSLINQDLLYLKKGSSGPEKINPHAKIFYIRKQKDPGKPKEIVGRRANECIVAITEPDFKNLNKNDIEDMYLLIMNGKVPDYAETGLLWSLSVFIRSSVIWERVHDFQLGIESYQHNVNLTASTVTFSGIEKHKMFSIIYEPVHGIIYKNSKKEKRVMRHSEIHKFCDATLNKVLEGLKSYNNDVLYGYVQRELTNDEIEYLRLFEEEIKAAKFVRDFKSLAKEADESIAKQKALELEMEPLLREVDSQYIMSIVQNPSVVDTSNLQTELEHMNERFENYIIKKENEYAKLWNDWYKKYTLNPLPQKLENENVELEFQVKNYEKEIAHLKTADKNLFDSINERPKWFHPKVVESNDLSKPVTSNSAPYSRESTVVNNERVIALGIFKINPFKASRVDNFMPDKHVKASVRTKPITVSQPHVITKKDVNSNTNGFSPKNFESTTRTRRPQPKNNPKSDKVPFKSKSSYLSNKLEKIEKTIGYVNGMKSRKKNQSAYVSKRVNQKKHKANVKKSKTLSSEDRLASSRPSKPRTCLKWLPTGRIFDLCGKNTFIQ
ncbi:hypothetical protein Tco_0649161 [Tanacetum coccineum]